MSFSTSSYIPAATGKVYEGDAGSTLAPGVGEGNDAGAAGDTSDSMNFSTGAMIAVIVVVVVVILIGVSTATLFFIAKRREWTVRETIRRSTRKIVDDIPPTPRLRPEDVEKGLASIDVKPTDRKFGRK
ncbi:hypothetical protein PT974_03535 [Cladobotryum mycophilum]|uniref:Uncharacterized protein n=1 Tax=Cladobotryum mycophilum TaxID=491253 RepID=A0ABR0SSK6_9HYPO